MFHDTFTVTNALVLQEVSSLLFTILSNNFNCMSYISQFTDQFVQKVSINSLCVVRAKNMADANDVI